MPFSPSMKQMELWAATMPSSPLVGLFGGGGADMLFSPEPVQKAGEPGSWSLRAGNGDTVSSFWRGTPRLPPLKLRHGRALSRPRPLTTCHRRKGREPARAGDLHRPTFVTVENGQVPGVARLG